METRIKQYVDYQFRFDKREDIDDLKAEIIANLIDRYHEYLNSGKTPDEAYIEAIKSIGDFSENPLNDIAEEYSIKPSIPDILLLSSTILSVFGLLIFFFDNIVGTIITVISIVLYSTSSYYLYSYSQYVRKEYKDIEKHNLLLTKIFKYLKTNFIFWAINLSFILAALVLRIINSIVLIDPSIVLFTDIKKLIIFYLILFIIFLIIFLLIFRYIYKRLMNHYYLLTGNKYLKGKIKESYEFLFGKTNKISNFKEKIKVKCKLLFSKVHKLSGVLFNRRFIAFAVFIIILIQFFIKIKIIVYDDIYVEDIKYKISTIYIAYLFKSLKTKYYHISLMPLFAILLNLVIILLILFNKLKKERLLFISFYFWFIATRAFYFFLERAGLDLSLVVMLYTFIMIILFTIYLIVRLIIIKRRRKKDAISR